MGDTTMKDFYDQEAEERRLELEDKERYIEHLERAFIQMARIYVKHHAAFASDPGTAGRFTMIQGSRNQSQVRAVAALKGDGEIDTGLILEHLKEKYLPDAPARAREERSEG